MKKLLLRRAVQLQVNRDCEHYGCLRKASWLVAEERDTSTGRYESAELVRVHYYCEWHYEYPVLWRGKDKTVQIVRARPD